MFLLRGLFETESTQRVIDGDVELIILRLLLRNVGVAIVGVVDRLWVLVVVFFVVLFLIFFIGLLLFANPSERNLDAVGQTENAGELLIAVALDERGGKGQFAFRPELFAREDTSDSITGELERVDLLLRPASGNFRIDFALFIVRRITLVVSLLA